MIINFDALKERDAELYKLAQAYTGCKSGDHKLDQSRFPNDIWERLVAFVNKPEEQRPDPSVRMREDSQRAAAAARIEQLQEEGLLDNEANSRLIGDYFRDNKLAFNVANVNNVILHVLRADLAWAPKLKVAAVAPPPAAPVAPQPAAAIRVDLDLLRSKHSAIYNTIVRMIGHNSGVHEVDVRSLTIEAQKKLEECAAEPVAPVAPVVPAPAPPAEVLGKLPDGSTQLPLESSEYVLRRASKAQVADWLSRKRAVTGKYLRPRGSWGTSL